MFSTSFRRASFVCGVFGILALHAPLGVGQSTQPSAEKLNKAAEIYAQLRQKDPQLEPRSPEQVATDLDERARDHRARMPDTRTATARASGGGVVASARCADGYVLSGSYRADDQSARIVAENRRDCDARGCRAYEVSATSESGKPFNLTASVTCST